MSESLLSWLNSTTLQGKQEILRRKALKAYSNLSEEDKIKSTFHWPLRARPEQLPPPGNWLTWVVLAGRGFGKTRTGVEWIRDQVENHNVGRIAIVGRTVADIRDTIINGESGLLSVCPPWFRPIYIESKRKVIWPNGAFAITYTAEEPDLLRGPQHEIAYCDELASWKYPETWDMLLLGLRLGTHPQCVVTTTPKPRLFLRNILESKTTVVTRGSTYDNKENLPESFFKSVIEKYENTTLGRQEIYAELFTEMPGALWKRETLDKCRSPDRVLFKRVVVAIDPAVTSKENSDETGIIVCGAGENGYGYDDHGFVIKDLSGRYTPDSWARVAVNAYHKYGADRIVAEVNQGGDLVESVLRTVDPTIPYCGVHASKSKRARAEPIAARYEQGKIHHIGIFPNLEDQLCNYVASSSDTSPDRLDALVWGFTALFETSFSIITPKLIEQIGNPWQP